MSCTALGFTVHPTLITETFAEKGQSRQSQQQVGGWVFKMSLAFPSLALLNKVVCLQRLPVGSFYYTYAYVLALDIIISRFVQGAPR